MLSIEQDRLSRGSVRIKRKHFFLFAFLVSSFSCVVLSAPLAQNISESSQATLRIRAGDRLPYPIPKYITGKFCEHLGFNIYHGMDAQILHNPTLADYPFSAGEQSPDGGVKFHFNREEIARRIRRRARELGWPGERIEGMTQAYKDGLACWWTRQGKGENVKVSPDVGEYGQRAQRIEVGAAGQGIAQWTFLPLHRIRRYEFELIARSPELNSLSVTLTGPNDQKPCAKATVRGLSGDWKTLRGNLEVGFDWPADVAYKFALTTNAGGQFLVERIMLWPADHVGGADPDIINLLKESHLPVLRWPGGNFVSNYHWQDGIGPAEKRPTLPNDAWGRVETNLFGTDEFIAYCRAVGCEPMICINAGSGTPAEAARWVQYCNGAVDTPMGGLRAANGHPEPYNVRHWEIGNELWGRWQYYWTTASGYVDRYKNFAKAVLAADPTIELYACGAPVFWGKEWNDELIKGTADILKITTDHPLIGGAVSSEADPLDVYRDFMAVPKVLEEKWAALEQDMKNAGIRQPRLAITELQMFARIDRSSDSSAPRRLTRDNLVGQRTLTEGIYNVLIYHAAIRLSPFINMVTHSATVNHGGGLRKQRERVYAQPCHYAQAMFADFANATPVDMELKSPVEQAPLVMPDLKRVTSQCAYNSIDALAAVTNEGELLISIIHRGTSKPIQLAIIIEGFDTPRRARLRTLSGDKPWAANSLTEPDKIKPVISFADIRNNKLMLDLQPYTLMQVQIRKSSSQ
jgi:alpha-N-arabinofuranosidase